MNFYLPIKSFSIYVHGDELTWDKMKPYRMGVPLNPEFPADHIYNALYELCIYSPNVEKITDVEIVVDEMLPDLTEHSMRYSMKENNMTYPREMLEAILKTKVQKALGIHGKKYKPEQPKGMIASISKLFKEKATE